MLFDTRTPTARIPPAKARAQAVDNPCYTDREVNVLTGIRQLQRVLLWISGALAIPLALALLGSWVLDQFGCAYRAWMNWAMCWCGILLCALLIAVASIQIGYIHHSETREPSGCGCMTIAGVLLALEALVVLTLFIGRTRYEADLITIQGKSYVIEHESVVIKDFYNAYEYRNFLWRGPSVEGLPGLPNSH